MAREPMAALRLVNAYGRLPLALGLVGARLAAASGRFLPLRDVVARLQGPHGGGDDLAFRMGADPSVVATLSASYERLNDKQRQVFHAIGLLDANEVEAKAVAAAAGVSPEQAETVLGELVDANLLEVAPRLGGRRRWRVHPLIRLYARYIARRLP